MSILLGIGSNIGNRKENLIKSCNLLEQYNIIILKESKTIETIPYGYSNQNYFLNKVISVKTNLLPEELLRRIKMIEHIMGREKTIKWGPRIIDIDILFYDDKIIQKDNIQVPHPDMHNRLFIMESLYEIEPELIHPILHKSIKFLYKTLKEKNQNIILSDSEKKVYDSYSKPILIFNNNNYCYANKKALSFFNIDEKDNEKINFKQISASEQINSNFHTLLNEVQKSLDSIKDISLEWIFMKNDEDISIKTTFSRFSSGEKLYIAKLEEDFYNDLDIDKDVSKFLFDNGEFGLWSYNIKDKTSFYNKKYKEIFSIEDIEISIISTFYKKAHIGDIKNISETITSILEGKIENYKIAYRIINNKNNWIWIEEIGNLIRDDKNKPFKLVGIVRNITAEKDSEAISKAILTISKSSNSSNLFIDLIKLAHETISELIICENFYVAIYDRNINALRFPYLVSEFNEHIEVSPFGKGLTEYVVKTGKTLLCNQKKQKELIERKEVANVENNCVIWLGVPMIVDNVVMGVIAVQDYEYEDTYGEREKNFLELISSELAHCLKRNKDKSALKESNEKFKQITESMPGEVFLFDITRDKKRNVIFSSNCLKKIFKDLEVDNTFFFDNIAKNTINKFYNNDLKDFPDSPIYNDHFITINNERKFFQSISTLIKIDSNTIRVIGILLDFTKIKNIEKEFTNTKDLLDNILSLVPIGIINIDINGKIKYINKKITEVTGYDNDLIGKRIYDLMFFENNDNIIVDERKKFNSHIKIPDINGNLLYLFIQTIPIFDLNNKYEGFIIFVIDESKSNYLENQLSKLQQLDSFGSIISGISHDFNNFLTVIAGNLNLLYMDSEYFSLEHKKCIEVAINANNYAGELINKIGKVYRNKDELVNFANVYKCFNEVVNMLNSTTEKYVNVSFEIDDYETNVNLSSTEFIQVLLNLGTNSHKAILEKESLKDNFIKYYSKNIKLSVDNNINLPVGDYCHVIVEDSGAGMDEEILKNATNLMFSTRRESNEGQGLGLSMVKNIVTKNDGNLIINSIKNVGTKVHLYLPIPNNIQQNNFDYKDIYCGNESILIVNKDENIKHFVFNSLSIKGYNLINYNFNKNLIEFVNNLKNLDMIIIDSHIFDIEDKNLILRLKEVKKNIKIILTTNTKNIDNVIADNIDNIVEKPFRLYTLYNTIRETLDK